MKDNLMKTAYKKGITVLLTFALLMTVFTINAQTGKAAGNQNWAPVGNIGFSAGEAEYTSLCMDNGTPYVAYIDVANGNKATVMKYTGSAWEAVGTAGFSAGSAYSTSLYVDNGTPYVAYSDDANGYKATVMKYTGIGSSGWETVGTAAFSAGQATYVSLYVDNGTPYVAYRDGNVGKATVMRYTDSGWETVGIAAFSAGEVKYTSLYVDNGTPYVAYRDGGNGNKATVMKYTDSGWNAVETAGFSAGTALYTSLYVDNGTPYVAYSDDANVYKATVMKYTGSAWEAVGTAGFSAGGVEYTSLYVDNGTPYVAYMDWANGNKATVMKYEGSGWAPVGTAGFSAGGAFYNSLYVDRGTPYVAYMDYANGYKATVMKLNNAPTGLDLDDNKVPEDEALGTVVGTLSAQDTDAFDNLTYSLVSGEADNSMFSIDGNQLKTAAVFDYEMKHSYSVRIRVTDNGGLFDEETLTIDIQNVYGDINDNKIVVDMGPVPSGAVDSAFSFVPTVTKGTAPYSWTATGLPAGLGINSATGEISGIPISVGTSAVSATVTDSLNASLTIEFGIKIGYADLSIDNPNLLGATLGEAYSCALTASGGDGSFAWYASGLPKGLSISSNSGQISGNPKETGTFNVKVNVYDGEWRKSLKTYSLTVASQTATGKYTVTPDADSAYTIGSSGGIVTVTINSGVTGFRYIGVTVEPTVTHEGTEVAVFTQFRGGVQIDFSAMKADFDDDNHPAAGFNVKAGDIIKIYIVDDLSNATGNNPVLLQ